MRHAADDISKTILAAPILIVDDSEINRIFLEKTLRIYGFTTLLSVESGEKALEQLPVFKPEIILLDIVMTGGMDGYACCKTIRSKGYGDLPILIQTMITDPNLRVEAFKSGATDFVSKPVYPQELCARVVVHLERLHSLKTLQLYKNRTEQELNAARRLQESVLPDDDQINVIRRRCGMTIAAYFEPSSEIGGDFWGINNLFPHQTALWLVDFSGHGIEAALNAFRLQAYLKDHSSLAARPGEYLSHLNDKLLHLLMRGQFATMFYGIIDQQTNQLFYACACVPNPIILSRATGTAHIIDGTGNLLGTGMNLYITQNIPFNMGDILLLYSDTVVETPNDAGDFITEDQLISFLEGHRDLPANTLKDDLLKYFRQHAGDRIKDDLTIVVCARSVEP